MIINCIYNIDKPKVINILDENIPKGYSIASIDVIKIIQTPSGDINHELNTLGDGSVIDAGKYKINLTIGHPDCIEATTLSCDDLIALTDSKLSSSSGSDAPASISEVIMCLTTPATGTTAETIESVIKKTVINSNNAEAITYENSKGEVITPNVNNLKIGVCNMGGVSVTSKHWGVFNDQAALLASTPEKGDTAIAKGLSGGVTALTGGLTSGVWNVYYDGSEWLGVSPIAVKTSGSAVVKVKGFSFAEFPVVAKTGRFMYLYLSAERYEFLDGTEMFRADGIPYVGGYSYFDFGTNLGQVHTMELSIDVEPLSDTGYLRGSFFTGQGTPLGTHTSVTIKGSKRYRVIISKTIITTQKIIDERQIKFKISAVGENITIYGMVINFVSHPHDVKNLNVI